MENSLAIAIIGGLGAMFGWGFADFFAKKTIDKLGDLTSLVWAHLFGTAFFVLLALFNFAVTGHFIHLPSSASKWLALIFFGVLQMIVYWLVYRGFSKGQLSVLNPVFASYSGLVALISVIFLAEVLTGPVAAALVLIFGGILLMNTDLQDIKAKNISLLPGIKEVGAAAILAAVWTILWDKFVSGQDFLAYALFMYLFMTLAALGAARSQNTKLLPVERGYWKFLALIGLGEAIAYLSLSYGFSRTTHTSVVALISGSFSLVTIVLAGIFLKERLTRLQQLSAAVIILGIALISLYS